MAAGINLPARSVLLTSLIKGPPGKKKLIDASSAHQMFGRAGRPQFDTEGYVFAIPDEDDVKILRWKEKYDQIPEDTKDPMLRQAKKRMKKKMPTRNSKKQYWNEDQFEKLRNAPSANLSSRGHLPWRILAWLLKSSSDVMQLRKFIARRMLAGKLKENAEKQLYHMLRTLGAGGFVTLTPPPPVEKKIEKESVIVKENVHAKQSEVTGTFGSILQEALGEKKENDAEKKSNGQEKTARETAQTKAEYYKPTFAEPTEKLDQLLQFRSINPLYACFLLKYLGKADEFEQIQLIESVLEVPGSVVRDVRVPYELMKSGELARAFLDVELIERGLVPAHLLSGEMPEDPHELRYDEYPPTVADKMRLLFQSDFPGVHGLRIAPVWIVGDLLKFNGNFNKYVSGRDLIKQEGIIFRHLLRFVLLLQEFLPIVPEGIAEEEWQTRLMFWSDTITKACREVDPVSTDKTLEAKG